MPLVHDTYTVEELYCEADPFPIDARQADWLHSTVFICRRCGRDFARIRTYIDTSPCEWSAWDTNYCRRCGSGSILWASQNWQFAPQRLHLLPPPLLIQEFLIWTKHPLCLFSAGLTLSSSGLPEAAKRGPSTHSSAPD